MISSFVDFVHQLFPSINPYTKEKVKESLRQFERTGIKQNFFLPEPFAYLAQGDIVDELPFFLTDSNGNELLYKTKAMLISNTCDAENDKQIIFSPLYRIDEIDMNVEQLKRNQNYSMLYIPEELTSEYFIDLSCMNSFSRLGIEAILKSGKLRKLASLNSFGYYLFLSKLTVHFMRPEDSGVNKQRFNT